MNRRVAVVLVLFVAGVTGLAVAVRQSGGQSGLGTAAGRGERGADATTAMAALRPSGTPHPERDADARAEEDPEDARAGPAAGSESAEPSTPFRGRPWNHLGARQPDTLEDFRSIDDLLRDAGRSPHRVIRIRAFRDAVKVCRVWWRDGDPTGTGARILSDLLDLHASEPESKVRERELRRLAGWIPPQRADAVVDRAGERARNGETERERRAAISHLGAYAAKDIENQYPTDYPVETTRESIRPAAKKLSERALALLRGLPTDGRTDTERAEIAAAIGKGGGLGEGESK